MATRYLPAQAIALIQKLVHKNPIVSAIGAVILYTTVARWLDRRSGCGAWLEILFLSLFITTAIFFIAACFYILKTHPGFRLIGK